MPGARRRGTMRFSPWVVLALACVLSGQDFRATLNGRVTDPHNAPVTAVVVALRDVDKNETIHQTTGQDGNYIFTLVSPGNYELTVSHPGFKVYRRTGLTLNVNQLATVDVKLELGSTNEKITVTADVPMLELASGDRGGLVDGKTIAEMPLNGRN